MLFLLDPSPIMHWQCLSLTDSLTQCRLVNLIDVTLACEDGNSKLLEVTVLDVAGVSILMSYGENPHYVKLPIFSDLWKTQPNL